MAQLRDALTKDPAVMSASMVVATFIIGNSAPLQCIFGQIPNVWKGITDLNEKDCIAAACIGFVIRLAIAGICGRLLVFLW
jgi:hypothetical protein